MTTHGYVILRSRSAASTPLPTAGRSKPGNRRSCSVGARGSRPSRRPRDSQVRGCLAVPPPSVKLSLRTEVLMLGRQTSRPPAGVIMLGDWSLSS